MTWELGVAVVVGVLVLVWLVGWLFGHDNEWWDK